MTQQGNRNALRIAAMIEAAEEARQDASGSKEEFLRPGLIQKAVLLDLIHLTEAAEKISAGLKSLNPDIPWARLSRLRNQGLVHDYEEVDLEDVWSFVREELPRLRRRLDRLRLPRDPA